MADRACAVILDTGRILLVHQTYRGRSIWTFPGGSIEAGETPEATAIREVREEVGLHIQIVSQLRQCPRTGVAGTYYCYLGRVSGGQLALGYDPEHVDAAPNLDDCRWFPLDQVREHPEVTAILAALPPAPLAGATP